LQTQHQVYRDAECNTPFLTHSWATDPSAGCGGHAAASSFPPTDIFAVLFLYVDHTITYQVPYVGIYTQPILWEHRRSFCIKTTWIPVQISQGITL